VAQMLLTLSLIYKIRPTINVSHTVHSAHNTYQVSRGTIQTIHPVVVRLK
jgi:hypothetical protein